MTAKLPLHDVHVEAGARFSPFAGYDMPMRYTTIKEEHKQVRNAVGVFDVSHMGEVFIRGEKALEAVNYLVTNDVAKLTDGQALYTMMCREDGGVVDDLIVYRLSLNEFLLCIKAANRASDLKWIQENLPSKATAADDRQSKC